MINILNTFAFFFVVEDYLLGKSTAVAAPTDASSAGCFRRPRRPRRRWLVIPLPLIGGKRGLPSSSTKSAATRVAHQGSFLFPFNFIFILRHLYYHHLHCRCSSATFLSCLILTFIPVARSHTCFLLLTLTFRSLPLSI